MNSSIRSSRRLVLVSPGYNCEKYLDLWYNSLKLQNYTNWICFAIDDISTDNTYSKLCKLTDLDNRIISIKNKVKKYQLKNWYHIIHFGLSAPDIEFYSKSDSSSINPDDIIIFMDMDDWFGTKYAFEYTIKEFLFRDIKCLTARNYQLSDGYNHDARLYNSRDDLLTTDQHEYSLYAYEAQLFLNIPGHHFINPETNEWYRVCGDYAITMPILYQSGPKYHHHLFIDNFIIYNNIRLECDDNKFIDGLSEHELTWPLLTQSFREMVVRNELPTYC